MRVPALRIIRQAELRAFRLLSLADRWSGAMVILGSAL
jgi:hypothetical protein